MREEGLYKQLECTLSQLLLPSLATIARSDPFQYTRGFNEDQLVYGFADYVGCSEIRMVFQPELFSRFISLLVSHTIRPIYLQVHPNIFRLNQLRLREDARWEVVVSNYRLLTLS